MAFTTPLRLEETRTGWRLLSNLAWEYRDHDGVDLIIVPRGFETDLDSVPRLPVVYALFKGRSRSAAVLHDFLYSTSYRHTRKEADDIFLLAMKETGVPLWQRWPIWFAVRLFGGAAWVQVKRTL